MGKRKSKDEEHLRKKIRKLERKLRKLSPTRQDSQEVSTTPARLCSPKSPTQIEEPEAIEETTTENDLLPEEFLLALGKEGEEETEFGDPIRSELALRWTKIMSDGLGKEAKDGIIQKYSTPSNFQNAVAPRMNPEIMATLSEPSVKRDKRIIARQNLTGTLMTCLGRSLTSILKGNINSKALIEEINDAAKIAAEIHFQDSSSRKFFGLSGASKIIQEAVKNSKVDAFLFGADCADKIRAAQSIQRTSTIISEGAKRQKPANKKQLNWRGPPQNRQQHQQVRGGQHHQQQMYKRQPRFSNTRRLPERKHPPARSKHYR